VENKTRDYIIGAVLLCGIIFGAGFLFGRASLSDDSNAARQLQKQLDTIVTNQSAITDQIETIGAGANDLLTSNSGIQQSIERSQAAVDASITANTTASESNQAAASTSKDIATNSDESGRIIKELQTIIDDVSKNPQTP